MSGLYEAIFWAPQNILKLTGREIFIIFISKSLFILTYDSISLLLSSSTPVYYVYNAYVSSTS